MKKKICIFLSTVSIAHGASSSESQYPIINDNNKQIMAQQVTFQSHVYASLKEKKLTEDEIKQAVAHGTITPHAEKEGIFKCSSKSTNGTPLIITLSTKTSALEIMQIKSKRQKQNKKVKKRKGHRRKRAIHGKFLQSEVFDQEEDNLARDVAREAHLKKKKAQKN